MGCRGTTDTVIRRRVRAGMPYAARTIARTVFGVAYAACTSCALGNVDRDDMLGAPGSVVVDAEDTLLDVGPRFDVGYVAMRLANPGVDPWLPRGGTAIAIPSAHLLPDAPRTGIVINLPELRLYYYPPTGGTPLSFPVGIGDEGKGTPIGHAFIVRKQTHPTWWPTVAERAENPDLPAVVEPGPDNPMGNYALYLDWNGYAIHGSNKPYSIGRRDSHGCVRMYGADIERLYRAVVPGTEVRIVNQTVKVGWRGGELYLEVHPPLDETDGIEAGARPRDVAPAGLDRIVRRAAGPTAQSRIDWDAVNLAAREKRGLPIQVTR